MNGLDLAPSGSRGVRHHAHHHLDRLLSEELRADVGALGNVEIMHKEHTFEELGPRAGRAIRGFPPSQ